MTAVMDTARRVIAALAACSRHNAAHVPSLSACTNLAPSGTGSHSLTAFLRHSGSAWAHHDHGATLRGYRRDWSGPADADSLGLQRQRRPANSTPPSCFIITLREPAARLESIKRYQDQLLSPLKWDRAADLNELVRRNHMRWVMDGRQLDYLLPVELLERECATRAVEVHLLCTEALDADFARLLSRFDAPPRPPEPAGARRNHAEALAARHNVSRLAATALLSKSMLQPQMRELVNRVAYADDSALHERFCGPRSIRL
jgi:hypothetical protein